MSLSRSRLMPLLAVLLLGLGLALAGSALAQQAASSAAPTRAAAAPQNNLPSVTDLAGQPLPQVNVGQVGGEKVSMPLQVLLLMTSITLLPAALLGMTAFTRVIIVLGLLRQALGTGQTPSNQVLLALALFLTFMIMTPVFDASWTHGIAPYLDKTMDFKSAWSAAIEPFRGFMLAQVR
jgi:flagellar biosynthetic protein FliP